MRDLPRSALVVGLARSGSAAAAALARRGIRVVAVDRSSSVDTGRLAGLGVEVRLGTEEESLLDAVDVVVKSPGVRSDAPLIMAARSRARPVWSEVELGYRLLSENPIVGVTGTNGKTTTSELLGAMLGAQVAGNVGRALCELDGLVAPGEPIVCELSSFQLEDIDAFRVGIGVLLNLTPDHLDRHGSFEAYRQAKLRIFENQREQDVAVAPAGFGAIPGRGRRIDFTADDPLPADPLMPGRHNRENAAAAAAAARYAGADEAAIAAALRTFAGVAHRLELVRERRGVRFVNDSKATNTAAARRALAAYGDAPLRLILGGSLKGERFDGLARELPGTVRSIYLIGEAADELAAALGRVGASYERAGDLATAVRAAAAAAGPGDVVLLSPACASYDQFRDFEHRGDTFRDLVEAL